MPPREFRALARNALQGSWGITIFVTIAAGLLGANTNISSLGSSVGNASVQYGASNYDWMNPVGLTLMLSIFSLLLLYVFFALIFGGAAELGLICYNVDLITKRRPASFSVLFSRFSIFGRAFCLRFLTSLFTSLWALLFVIPGIIAAYRYAMAPYLMAEYPGLRAMEAIRLSKEKMRGYKMDLFLLQLSFIGWGILCLLTFGIGFLWLTPYIKVSETVFFRYVEGNSTDEPKIYPDYRLQ